MKEIFDWLRGAILDKAFEDYNGLVVVDVHDVGDLINEAEAKWEKDCCEWEFEKNTGIVWHCENECESYNLPYQMELQDFLEKFKSICPHCGKSIKISEVD